MELRQSTFDTSFWEVISDGIVIKEIRVSIPFKGVPRFFASLEEITIWLEEKEYKIAKNYALWLLGRRSYSKAMLFKKLKEKRVSEPQSTRLIEEFEKLGYLSDNDYARAMREQKIRQGYGPRYIEQYFRSKGLDPKLAKTDEVSQKEALKKWETKLRGKDPAKRSAFLLRKGFDFEFIRKNTNYQK
jgi:SOS response regulatory protein OraA/RecX